MQNYLFPENNSIIFKLKNPIYDVIKQFTNYFYIENSLENPMDPWTSLMDRVHGPRWTRVALGHPDQILRPRFKTAKSYFGSNLSRAKRIQRLRLNLSI